MRDKAASEFRFSQALYARLLAAYPARHRLEYGPAMAQLFRDQCRDARRQSPKWGLLMLWGRILPELAATSIWERLAALKERKTMSEKLENLSTFRPTPVGTFFKIFVAVFLAVVVVSVAITYILPESFASTARVKVESDSPAPNAQGYNYDPYFVQTTFEVMQSDLVLKPVVQKLDLNSVWGKKYFQGETLKTTESMEILKQRLRLAPVRNTSLISITAYSDDRNDAAQIANAVAESYQNYRMLNRQETEMSRLAALNKEYDQQDFRIRQDRVELDALRQKLDVPEHVDGLEAELTRAKGTYEKQNIQLSLLRQLSDPERRNALTTVVPDAALADLLAKLHEAEQKYATLTNDYSSSNLVVLRVTALIDVLNRQIDERVAGIMAGLANQVAALKASTDQLAAALEKSKPNPANEEYWQAKRDLDQAEEGHKLLFGKLAEAKLDADLPKPAVVQITDRAEPAYAPVRPNKTLDIFIGTVLGAVLAAALGGLFVLLTLPNRRPKDPAAA